MNDGPAPLFGGLKIAPDDKSFVEEAQRCYLTDAEFHYRVDAVVQVMDALYVQRPSRPEVAVALLIDAKVRKANDLR